MAKHTKSVHTAKKRAHKYKSRATLSKIHHKLRHSKMRRTRKHIPVVKRNSPVISYGRELHANSGSTDYSSNPISRRDISGSRRAIPYEQLHANSGSTDYSSNPISRRDISGSRKAISYSQLHANSGSTDYSSNPISRRDISKLFSV